jgi:hypothetical protein
MILINFSSELNHSQIDQAESLLHKPINKIINLPAKIDPDLPILPQLKALIAQLPLSAEQLKTEAILINPPTQSYLTALLLAELHGRMGRFPPILRIYLQPFGMLPRMVVADVLDLQAIEDSALRNDVADESAI